MKRDWTSRTTLLLVGVILVVVNLIGVNLFVRADLTDDGVYSLSPASRQLAEDLDDPVTITAYFTDNLPAPYSGNRRFLKDKLDDYRAYGGRNLQYRFVDPNQDPDAESRAGQLGIPPVQIQVIESDNVQLKNAYMGLAIEYAGEREVIPLIQDLSTLEYDLTSSIRRLTRDVEPRVGFLTGHGETPMSDMQTLVEELRRNYAVESVSIEDSSFNTTTDVLFIVAPTDTLPPSHLRALDEFVFRGGHLALFVNAVAADLQSGQAEAVDVGFSQMLAAYGIRVRPDLVMDRQSSAITVQRRAGSFNVAQQIEYPFLPIATSFSDDNMMVNRLRELRFFFVSSLDTLDLPSDVVYEPVALSSAESATQEGFFMIQAQFAAQLAGQPLEGGPYTLAAAVSGALPSAFGAADRGAPTRIVVVGDGDLLNESLIGRVPGNIEFGLNVADWLAQDEALLAIRTKSVAPRRLEEVSESKRPFIKYANFFGPVLIVIVFGLVRLRRNRLASKRQFIRA